MLKNGFRFLVLLLLITASFGIVTAQRVRSIEAPAGFALEYPFAWDMRLAEDSENVLIFDDGAMFGFISMIEAEFVGDDPQEILDDVLRRRSRSDRNDGELGEFEAYRIDGEWEAVRTSRIRESDRAYEVYIMANVREISVYVQASFRRGAEDEYLPQFDAMIGTVRLVEDSSILINPPEIPRPTFNVETIGTGDALLNIGALSATISFENAGYQVDYPQEWEISTNSDGSLRFINRGEATVFGSLALDMNADNTPESSLSLFLADEADYGEMSSFSLNGLRAARAYRENTRGGTVDIAMAAHFGDLIAILQASSNVDTMREVEPILRAVLYSVRPVGRQLELSLVGHGAREALNSAFIFGNPVQATPIQTGIPLEQSYITDNGRYRLNYPENWVQAFEEASIVLASNPDFEIFVAEDGEIQIFISFLDRIRSLDIDDFSPKGILDYLIENDDTPSRWGAVTEFSSLGRRAAYADFQPRFTDVNGRSFFIELDEVDRIYVRVDMITKEDEIDDFLPVTLAILESIDFAD